jgi:hypothetical protein
MAFRPPPTPKIISQHSSSDEAGTIFPASSRRSGSDLENGMESVKGDSSSGHPDDLRDRKASGHLRADRWRQNGSGFFANHIQTRRQSAAIGAGDIRRPVEGAHPKRAKALMHLMKSPTTLFGISKTQPI